MAQAPRPAGKARKIFYAVMKTPKSLQMEGNVKKPTRKQLRGWNADYITTV
jgi:hypothetical protein